MIVSLQSLHDKSSAQYIIMNFGIFGWVVAHNLDILKKQKLLIKVNIMPYKATQSQKSKLMIWAISIQNKEENQEFLKTFWQIL